MVNSTTFSLLTTLKTYPPQNHNCKCLLLTACQYCCNSGNLHTPGRQVPFLSSETSIEQTLKQLSIVIYFCFYLFLLMTVSFFIGSFMSQHKHEISSQLSINENSSNSLLSTGGPTFYCPLLAVTIARREQSP